MKTTASPPSLRTGPDGRLQFLSPDSWIPVRVIRCFPWVAPGQFISLRDKDGKEAALIENPALLDSPSRQALESALSTSSGVIPIKKIRRIAVDIELRVWEVETSAGSRQFQTELDTWPEPIPGGGWIVRDITGDLYRIPNPGELDKSSRTLLWAFLD